MPKLSFDGVPVMAIVGADGKDLKEYIMEVNQLYSEYQVQQDNQEATLTALNNIRDTIQERGPKRAIMASLESMGFGSLNPDYPLASYTERFSSTNYQVSLEEIDMRRAGIIAALIAAGLGILYKMVSWIKNRFFGGDDSSGGSSGGGGSSSSSSSSSSGGKPGGNIATVIERSIAQEEKLTKKIEGFQGDLSEFTKALEKGGKEMDEKYETLKERMEKVMYTKWADFFINPTESNLFLSWRSESRSLITKEGARGISDEFLALATEVDKAGNSFTQAFTQMEQKAPISESVMEDLEKQVSESIEKINLQYADMVKESSPLPKMVSSICTSFGVKGLYADFIRTLKENNGIAQAGSLVTTGIQEAGNTEVRNPGWAKIRDASELGAKLQKSSSLYTGKQADLIEGEITSCRSSSAKIEQILETMRGKMDGLSKEGLKGVDQTTMTGYQKVRLKFNMFRASVVNTLSAVNCMLNIIRTVENHYGLILNVTLNWISAAADYSAKKNTISGAEITDPAVQAALNEHLNNGAGDKV